MRQPAMHHRLLHLLHLALAGVPSAGSSRVFNVLHYGARGDGLTNDTAAIRSALASAGASGGGGGGKKPATKKAKRRRQPTAAAASSAPATAAHATALVASPSARKLALRARMLLQATTPISQFPIYHQWGCAKLRRLLSRVLSFLQLG